MRNLDIADTRSKLEQYAANSATQLSRTYLFGALEAAGLEQGGADQIAARSPDDGQIVADESALDSAAMEFGVD